jgi:hypothetical protein
LTLLSLSKDKNAILAREHREHALGESLEDDNDGLFAWSVEFIIGVTADIDDYHGPMCSSRLKRRGPKAKE